MEQIINTEDQPLFVREVTLNRTWRIVFKRPDMNQNGGQLRDGDAMWGDGTPNSFYWLDLDIFNLNGGRWEPEFRAMVKFDGCSNWWQTSDSFHMCGPDDAKLFGIVYEESRRLLGAE